MPQGSTGPKGEHSPQGHQPARVSVLPPLHVKEACPSGVCQLLQDSSPGSRPRASPVPEEVVRTPCGSAPARAPPTHQWL